MAALAADRRSSTVGTLHFFQLMIPNAFPKSFWGEATRGYLSVGVKMLTFEEVTSHLNGASFFRADLHIHSFGGSHDVKDREMTSQAIVDTALAENLSVIAITDHNEISNVGAAVAAASEKEILVIPGVE